MSFLIGCRATTSPESAPIGHVADHPATAGLGSASLTLAALRARLCVLRREEPALGPEPDAGSSESVRESLHPERTALAERHCPASATGHDYVRRTNKYWSASEASRRRTSRSSKTFEVARIGSASRRSCNPLAPLLPAHRTRNSPMRHCPKQIEPSRRSCTSGNCRACVCASSSPASKTATASPACRQHRCRPQSRCRNLDRNAGNFGSPPAAKKSSNPASKRASVSLESSWQSIRVFVG